MIFRPELARLVVAGRKTQTRRVVRRAPVSPFVTSRKTGEQRRRPNVKTIVLPDGKLYVACRYAVGHSYSVQPGRGKAAIARLTIQNVDREHVGEITYDDARAEGFRTTAEFKAYWVRMHDAKWVAATADRINPDRGLDDWPTIDDLIPRFDDRHADTLVWVITFEHEQHPPRLLALRPDPHSPDPDYTTESSQALADEPEAVSAETLAHFTVDAAERKAELPGRREEALRRRAQSLARRLRQVTVTADRSGIEVGAQLDLIEQHLKVLERQIAA